MPGVCDHPAVLIPQQRGPRGPQDTMGAMAAYQVLIGIDSMRTSMVYSTYTTQPESKNSGARRATTVPLAHTGTKYIRIPEYYYRAVCFSLTLFKVEQVIGYPYIISIHNRSQNLLFH